MLEHGDGSITLTAHEFRVCHMFCELSAAEFKELLLAKDRDTLTVTDIVKQIERRVRLQEFRAEGPAQ